MKATDPLTLPLSVRSKDRWARVFVLAVPACFVALTAMATLLILADSPRELSRTEWDFRRLAKDLKMYRMINGCYPTTAQGLRALVEVPSVEPRPTRWLQLSTELPKDPWGRDYDYICPGVKNPESFDLLSKGKDGIEGTADDITFEDRPQRPSATPSTPK